MYGRCVEQTREIDKGDVEIKNVVDVWSSVVKVMVLLIYEVFNMLDTVDKTFRWGNLRIKACRSPARLCRVTG